MQKLKNQVVDRMLEMHLTKAEVDFMLEISHYQDDTGKIYGVYYKDVCKSIGISFQTFYVTMHTLAEKGLIRLEKAYYSDWDIVIQDNDFSYPGAFREGYVSTGHDIFYDDSFYGLKANEKLLALQFLKISGAGRSYHISVARLYEKYAALLQVSKRTIQLYLGKLKAFFSIGIKDKMYWITPLAAVLKNNAPRDIQNFAKYLGRTTCRRNKATYTAETFQNAIDLVKQYEQILRSKTAGVFLNAVKESIEKVNETVRDRTKWNRQLNPKFIHKLIRNSI